MLWQRFANRSVSAFHGDSRLPSTPLRGGPRRPLTPRLAFAVDPLRFATGRLATPVARVAAHAAASL